jgi:hypothetical protein
VTAAKPDYDSLYHRLFSDPVIVAQLLREFVAGPWLDGLELDRLERLNTKFHADTGERREGDLVWRIPRHEGGEAYVMLLLEFQSTPDPWMALRIFVYAGLLWQHLVREQRLPKDGRLPPILPVVLYNGDPRWRAAVDLQDLIGLPEGASLWRWQPGLRYHLIDEGAFGSGDLERRDGLPALLFRLENAAGPAELVGVADALLTWFAGHSGFQAARAVFVELLGAAMAPLGPGVRVPEALMEARTMLATRAEQWKQEWLREGEARGEQRGEQKGQATVLLRLLERRFGVLPEWARDRVLAADTVALEQWSVLVLDATSLEGVVGAR